MTGHERKQLTSQLAELGLTGLEAETYLALLELPAATAYQVAQVIGKPTANVYKAVRTLAGKGALIVRDGSKRVLSPIPPQEFIGGLSRRHQELATDVAEKLASLRAAPQADQLYAIASVDAVLERAATMLAAAKSVALVDAFPAIVERLSGDLRKLQRRKVKLYLQTYERTDIPAESNVVSGLAGQIRQQWNCEFLTLTVDGSQALFALCDKELTIAHQAYWSNSLFFSCLQHAGMLREHLYHELQAEFTSGKPTLARIRRLVQQHPTFYSLPAPGQQVLFEQFGVQDSSQDKPRRSSKPPSGRQTTRAKRR